jgi:hypothetical protein
METRPPAATILRRHLGLTAFNDTPTGEYSVMSTPIDTVTPMAATADLEACAATAAFEIARFLH